VRIVEFETSHLSEELDMRNKLALVTAFLLAYGGIAYATQQGSTARATTERKESTAGQMRSTEGKMKEQTDTTKDKMKRGGQNAPTSASTRSKEAPVK
jgi:hypothetical protein